MPVSKNAWSPWYSSLSVFQEPDDKLSPAKQLLPGERHPGIRGSTYYHPLSANAGWGRQGAHCSKMMLHLDGTWEWLVLIWLQRNLVIITHVYMYKYTYRKWGKIPFSIFYKRYFNKVCVAILFLCVLDTIYRPLRSGRIWHKVNF